MLKVKNAHKIFRVSSNRADDRLALNGLNLHVKEGEFVTIIGGKTGGGGGLPLTHYLPNGWMVAFPSNVLLNRFANPS